MVLVYFITLYFLIYFDGGRHDAWHVWDHRMAAEAHIIPFGDQVIRENPAGTRRGSCDGQKTSAPSCGELVRRYDVYCSAIYKALAVSTDSGLATSTGFSYV